MAGRAGILPAPAVLPLEVSVVLGTALIWLALLLMLDWPLRQRTALLSLVCAGLLLPGVLLILRCGRRAARSLRAVALALAGLATRDGLTGCWNHGTTDALLAHELQRAYRAGSPVAFVLLDLDHFKQINDHHGHGTGDAVLRALADAVRRRLRSSDVFGRIGGEEFGLVLPATDLAGARWLVETVRREVEAMVLANADDGGPVMVTVSAGVAVADRQSRLSGDRLYGQADHSLYEAKRAGRNRVEVHGGTAGATGVGRSFSSSDPSPRAHRAWSGAPPCGPARCPSRRSSAPAWGW